MMVSSLVLFLLLCIAQRHAAIANNNLSPFGSGSGMGPDDTLNCTSTATPTPTSVSTATPTPTSVSMATPTQDSSLTTSTVSSTMTNNTSTTAVVLTTSSVADSTVGTTDILMLSTQIDTPSTSQGPTSIDSTSPTLTTSDTMSTQLLSVAITTTVVTNQTSSTSQSSVTPTSSFVSTTQTSVISHSSATPSLSITVTSATDSGPEATTVITPTSTAVSTTLTMPSSTVVDVSLTNLDSSSTVASLSTSGGVDVSPTPTPPPITDAVTTVATTTPMGEELPYPLNVIVEFFTTATPNVLSGFGVGAGVVVIMVVILICICCCCICSRVKKKRRRQYDIRDRSMTKSSASIYGNGVVPSHYQRKSLMEESIIPNPEAVGFELDHGNMDYNNSMQFNERLLQETAVDDNYNGPSPPHRSQMSVAGDVFRESALPELSPMSYPSQLYASASMNQGLSLNQGLSVDEGVHKLSLSGDYLPRIPNGSPSLRHPTRMGRSLANEESKSNQGSRASIPGSKVSSVQGSRPSMFSSQTSFLQSGSRSQMYISNDPSSSMLGVNSYTSRDDDTLSLPLSGRTGSPLLRQNSLNSSTEVPTRDIPSGHALFSISHDIGSGTKDFASLTCIPNHGALVSADLGTVRVPMELDTPSKPDNLIESESDRKRSLNNQDWGALTTLSGKDDKSKEVLKPKEVVDSKEKATNKEEKTPESTPKKPRSKTMSRLEKLTSLRASLRQKAKRVSFQKNKSKESQKEKESVVVTNESAVAEQQGVAPANMSRGKRHSDTSDHIPSPMDSLAREMSRPRAQSELNYPQLSQPNLYYQGGHMMGQHPQQYAYVNYPQLSQSYGFPQPLPLHVPVGDPFGRGGVPPDYPVRYSGMVTPDFSDITTPDHGHYGNQDHGMTTPDQFLPEGSTSDEYHQSTSPNESQRVRSPNEFQRATSPTSSYTSNDDRAGSPDRFTETSTASESYRARSPNPYTEPRQPLPTLHERYNYMSNGYTSEMPNPDHFAGSSGGHYMGDVFGSPRRHPNVPTPEFPMGRHVAVNGYPQGRGREYYDERRMSYDPAIHDPYRDRRSSLEPEEYLHERRGSYDRTLEDPHHSRRGSYESGPPPGGYPPRSAYHSKQGSHDRSFDSPQHAKQGSHDQSYDFAREQFMRQNENGGMLRSGADRKQSRVSESSMNSDLSASRNRVSWNTEVIEYVRTPSDDSDFDLNQL